MSTKHTPGPWKRKGVLVYALHKVPSWRDEVNVFSCQVQGNGEYGAEQEELEANARLIQLAPDMEEALLDLLENVPVGFGNDAALDRAIKKAEGIISKAEGGK